MRLFEGTPFDIPPKCDRCDQLETDCQCPTTPVVEETIPPDKQRLKVFPERRKHGKTITCVKGVHRANIAGVLKSLKDQFGCGGTIKEDVIELQGDHTSEAKALLKQRGFKFR